MGRRHKFSSGRSKSAKRSAHSPRSANAQQTPIHPLAPLQQALGNRAVGRMVQAKLKVGAPGDKYEQEADRVADQVVSMAGPASGPRPAVSQTNSATSIQRIPTMEDEKRVLQGPHELAKGPHEEEEGVVRRTHRQEEDDDKLRRQPRPKDEDEKVAMRVKADAGGLHVSNQTQSQIDNLKGGGQPLPKDVRGFFEPRLGADFSDVHVHADSRATKTAEAINARAFTFGNDIAFGEGQYAPQTSEGKSLLAHELTHVVQQNGDLNPIIQKADLTSPRFRGNRRFERVLDNRAVLEKWDSGEEVRRLQQVLIDLGFLFPTFGADGIFGNETKAAVQEFQRANGLVDDGRVGFRTMAVLDARFPPVTLPANRSDPWTMNCVLQILCPWNRHAVENVLPAFNIQTFDSRTFPTETWDGTQWVSGTFESGGFLNPSTNEMGFLNTTSCEGFAFTIYHESWHAMQPSNLTTTLARERDAYINAEQWSIDIGVPGQTFENEATGNIEDLRTTDASGNIAVDEAAAERLVTQEYAGVTAVPGETVIARVGASDVRVRDASGNVFVRPAQVGDRVRGATTMTNLQSIDPADWDCSAIP